MKLHTHQELFNQSIRATAQRLGIAEIYVEKDYWVTLALHHIFHSPIAYETVFKGGTALSKCFGLIQRFSEDVDLVMVRKDTDTNSSMERKVKKPGKLLGEILPEIKVEGLTHKVGMLRKTVHQYPKSFKGKFGQVRDNIVLEASCLGRYEPYHSQQINSYIGEMMLAENQETLVLRYKMHAFEVNAMHVNRTLCEKIMSLVRFSYGANSLQQLKDKIRHTYDIHQLLKLNEVKAFFESDAFTDLFLSVKEDDRISFKTDNDWLDHPAKEALIFFETERVWEQLKASYSNDFALLVYGDLPNEKEIENTLKFVSTRLQMIKE